MGDGLKLLVGAACAAIIAAAGYYFWSEYQASRQAAEIAEGRDLRNRCLSALEHISKGDNQTLVANCLVQGALTDGDMARRRRELGVN